MSPRALARTLAADMTEQLAGEQKMWSKTAVALPEQVHVGQVTTIKHPYHGDTPTQAYIPYRTVSVPDSFVTMADSLIEQARITERKGDGKFKSSLKKLYQHVFERSTGIPVNGMSFRGKQYLVDVGNDVPGKVISDPNLSKEKLSLLSDLTPIVQNAEYVGSGNYIQHGNKNKPVCRYDYFETPVSICGNHYIAKFDVEVIPGANNYRTHQIVKVDLIASKASLVGPAPTASFDESNPQW